MLKKTIKYTDFNDVEREENFYFHMSQAELAEWELSVTGGLSGILQKMIQTKDIPAITKQFKKIILASYGEKSDDGKRFIKSEALSEAFAQTEAYSKLFMELMSDEKAAADFVTGIMPAEARAAINESRVAHFGNVAE